MERLAPVLMGSSCSLPAPSSSSSEPLPNPFLTVPWDMPWNSIVVDGNGKYQEIPQQPAPNQKHTSRKPHPKGHRPLCPPTSCMLIDHSLVREKKQSGERGLWWGKQEMRLEKQYLKVFCGFASLEEGEKKKERVHEMAHRLVCLAIHGPPLKKEGGVWAAGWQDYPICMHLCGCAQCLNPMHLAWATSRENHPLLTNPEEYAEVADRRRTWSDVWMAWRRQQALLKGFEGMRV